ARAPRPAGRSPPPRWPPWGTPTPVGGSARSGGAENCAPNPRGRGRYLPSNEILSALVGWRAGGGRAGQGRGRRPQGQSAGFLLSTAPELNLESSRVSLPVIMVFDRRPTSPGTDRPSARSLTELLRSFASDAAGLLRQEIALARL